MIKGFLKDGSNSVNQERENLSLVKILKFLFFFHWHWYIISHKTQKRKKNFKQTFGSSKHVKHKFTSGLKNNKSKHICDADPHITKSQKVRGSF